MFVGLMPIVVIGLFILASSVKILPEYQRGVLFTLGKFSGIKGPGLFFVIPGIQKMTKVDLRIVTMDVPTQDIITKDNITVQVNGVVYFRVHSPSKAIIKVANFMHATAQIAQTTLRSVIGQYELDEVLEKREEINQKLQHILDELTEPWGVKVTNVELKAIDLPLDMQRVIARQAEAERDKRAKIISADGELQASKKLAEAAEVLGKQKDAITLRYLDTMREISVNNKNSTTFFPFPIEFLNAFSQK